VSVVGSGYVRGGSPNGRSVIRRAVRSLSLAVLWTALGIVEATSRAEANDDLTAREKACADTASGWFKENWPDGKASTHNSESTASYTSHYHAKRDTCFMLVTVDELEYWVYGKMHTTKKQIIDVHAKQAFATYMETNSRQTFCIVEGRHCKTQAQWDVLVRALYFEDEAAAQEALKRQK